METAASRGRLNPFYLVLIAAIVCFAFFAEYLPPFHSAYIPFDMSGYHYPLMDGAFQALKSGRLPEWDSSIYCGVPLAGNIQAALFYPGTWLLFAASWSHARLPYENLQYLVLAHFALALVLCYRWLGARGIAPLPAAIGACLFAFSGFLMTQLQHFGLVAGFAWWPLAFEGIDESAHARRWRPLWKVATASAMVLLAGYPPFWVVFAVSVTAYSLHAAPRLLPALAVSLLLCAVQLAPAFEASGSMVRDARYGLPNAGPAFFLTFLVPNYFGYGIEVPLDTHPGFDYWYMGAASLFGMACCLRAGWRRTLPAVAMLSAALVFLLDPFGLVLKALSLSPFLLQLVRSWYFTAGIAAAVTLLAAEGLNAFLASGARKPMGGPLLLLVTAAWCARLLILWRPGGAGFATGGAAWLEPAVSLILFAAWAASGARLAGAAMLVLTLVELKAFGTSRRFNATLSPSAYASLSATLPGVDASAYEEMKRHPEYRVAVSSLGPFGQDLRHYGLATPQGFDPLLPAAYQKLAARLGRFYSDREFALDPANRAALETLGVRYFLAPPQAPEFAALLASPDFAPIDGGQGFARVFELKHARPAWSWAGVSRATRWEPESRAIEVLSAAGGHFVLTEQFYPGWRARIDGADAALTRCEEAFQCVDVPAGRHQLEFTYRSRGLRYGAAISLSTLPLLVLLLRRVR